MFILSSRGVKGRAISSERGKQSSVINGLSCLGLGMTISLLLKLYRNTHQILHRAVFGAVRIHFQGAAVYFGRVKKQELAKVAELTRVGSCISHGLFSYLFTIPIF